MKPVITALIPKVPCIVLSICALLAAVHSVEGWGWFLLAALITHREVSTATIRALRG